MFSSLTYTLTLLSGALPNALPTLASPVQPHTQPREIQSIGYIDPSTDEWSSTLSGVGPLILLIGERSTKQVLRNVRGPASAFSLAAAPLGLLSVVTSLIRFCGIQRLRAFIGYELEPRTVAGMEVTRVNCGGVSAHLTDGYVFRSTVANPASQLVALSFFEGTERGDLAGRANARIRAGEKFQTEKDIRGFPRGVADMDWVMHIAVKGEEVRKEVLDAVALAFVDAVGINGFPEQVQLWRQRLAAFADLPVGPSLEHLTAEDEITLRSPNDIRRLQTISTSSTSKSTTEKGTLTSIMETKGTISSKQAKAAPFWDFTFTHTFSAVSEFTTSTPASNISSFTIGLISFLSILCVHTLALWRNAWIISVGWLLVIIGYFGIVFGVLLSALIINSSCIRVHLDTETTRSTTPKSSQWKDGMVVAVKNTDSMDTTGSAFVSSPSMRQTLEAVYIKSISRHERLLASAVTISLVLAFIAHYLGLRAVKWWASIGELGICICAAFARSISNELQPRFSEVEGIKIDKRCMSTGIIRTQTSRLVEGPARGLDARAYSVRELDNAPTAGERVAFQTAKLCLTAEKIRTLVTRITGMQVQVVEGGGKPRHRAILATFTGGILFKEGLGFPATGIALAFRSPISCLAAPSSLLARAIMRQPEWTLEQGLATDLPLGNVYIFALQSMLDWWTLSEDRNDMGDLQRNLHWPMFLLNLAFFMQLLDKNEDKALVEELDERHGNVGEGDLKVARDVVQYLKGWAAK